MNIKILETRKRAEAITNLSKLSEGQQRYLISKSKNVGSSFANAFVRVTTYDFSPEDNVETLVGEICRTYASMNIKHSLKHRVSCHPRYKHDFTEVHELHQTDILKYDHKNLIQKQLKVQIV